MLGVPLPSRRRARGSALACPAFASVIAMFLLWASPASADLPGPLWPDQLTVDAQVAALPGSSSVASVQIEYDLTNKRLRLDFENAAGGLLFTELDLFSSQQAYLDVPASADGPAECIAQPSTLPMLQEFNWPAEQVAPTTYLATDAGADLTPGDPIEAVLSALGAASTAGPYEVTIDANDDLPTTVSVGQPGEPAVMTFGNYQESVDAGDFTPPPECANPSPPAPVVQAPPLSGTVEAGEPFSTHLSADAIPLLPASFASTSASVPAGAGYAGQLSMTGGPGPFSYRETSGDAADMGVTSSGAITAPPSLGPGTYTVGGDARDASGETGPWTFSLTVGGSSSTPSPLRPATPVPAAHPADLAPGLTQGPTSSPGTVNVDLAGDLSAPGTLPPGTYSVSGTTTDGFGETGTFVYALTVTQATTTLVAESQLVLTLPPGGIGFGVVSATLRSDQTPVAGQTIEFSTGTTRLCSATTNAAGVASCTVNPADELAVLIANRYTASFAGSPQLAGSHASTPAIVIGSAATPAAND
jgi:hypothetical protein